MAPDIDTAPAAVAGKAAEAPVSGRYVGTETRTFPIDVSKPEATHDRRPSERPRRGWFSTRPHETLVPKDEVVYTPQRTVLVDGRMIETDRDIEILAGDRGYSVATVTLWNLSTESWAAITRDSTVEIRLGWDRHAHTAFFGNVLTKRARYRGGDVGYVLRARSHVAGQMHARGSRSYGRVAPHFIVDDIVQHSEFLETGYISTESERMDREYVITTARSIRDWLDELAEIATDQTGRRWVWYVDKDKLSFHPRTTQTSDLVTFSGEKTVRRATPAGMTTPTGHGGAYEVLTRCEPIVRRSLTCNVEETDAIDEDELYRVAKYVHESSTTTGKHHTTMLLEPLDTTVEEAWVT